MKPSQKYHLHHNLSFPTPKHGNNDKRFPPVNNVEVPTMSGGT